MHDETPRHPVPELPGGRHLELPDRGTTFVREDGPTPGSRSGPVSDLPLVLLHGWTATADLNWFRVYAPLGAAHRFVALDHRGHGLGIRSRRPFSFEDCADDAMAVCDELGFDEVVVVGYSMGGPVALETWRRHRDRVRGLVLCATAPHFADSREERLNFLGLSGLAAISRATPTRARAWLTEQLYLQRRVEGWEPWAVEQVSHHDWRMILEAGRCIGEFSARPWLHEIDAPTAVVLTMRDEIVPIRRQIELFDGIDGATAHRVDGGHDSVVAKADTFAPTLLDAIASVQRRVRLRPDGLDLPDTAAS
ncbi:MAG: alpha/beta hydrolase [Ilumatobacteraceae bacterium]